MIRALCSLGLAAGLVLAAARAADDRVGVVTHFDQDWKVADFMPLVSDLGVGWIRDGVSWGDVEPEKGKYVVPAKTQAWLDAAHERHIHVLLVLYYANKNYADPFSPPDYANAAAFLAQKLKDRVDAIEILNEPNNSPFGPTYGGTWNGYEPGGKVSPWVKKYAELINAAVPAIKKANPRMKVIGYGAPPPATFRMLALGAPKQLDGITDHPYSGSTMKLPELVPYPATPDLVQRDGIATADREGTYRSQCAMFRTEAAKVGLPHAELWNTEWGFATWTDPKEKPPYTITPEMQAVYTLRRLLEARALNVMSFYYGLRDDGTDGSQEWQNFGLVDYHRTKKPVFDVFKRFTAMFAGLMGDGTADGFAVNGPKAARCYAYHREGSSDAWVAWWKVTEYPGPPVNEPAPLLELPAGSGYRHAVITNLYAGTEHTLPIGHDAAGHASCQLEPSPVPVVIHFSN